MAMNCNGITVWRIHMAHEMGLVSHNTQLILCALLAQGQKHIEWSQICVVAPPNPCTIFKHAGEIIEPILPHKTLKTQWIKICEICSYRNSSSTSALAPPHLGFCQVGANEVGNDIATLGNKFRKVFDCNCVLERWEEPGQNGCSRRFNMPLR